MFLLKCGFWLSLVYVGLLCPSAPFGRHLDQTASAPIGAGLAVRAAPRLAAEAMQYCRANPRACLVGSAQLTALFDSVQREGEAGLLPDPPPSKPSPQSGDRGAKTAKGHARAG